MIPLIFSVLGMMRKNPPAYSWPKTNNPQTTSCLIYPLVYLFMRKWLQKFAYRTTISIDILILGVSLALMIAWLTISYQAIKAALTNPVDALRY